MRVQGSLGGDRGSGFSVNLIPRLKSFGGLGFRVQGRSFRDEGLKFGFWG